MFCAMFRRLGPTLLLVVLPAIAAAQEDAIFTDMGLDQAITESQRQNRILLVYFTTDWCGPCQVMKQTTWTDPDVIAWLGEHTVALRIDGDRRAADAQRLNIVAYPTFVAFRDGREFDRMSGYASPEGLLQWLEPIRQGVHPLDALRTKAEQSGDVRDQFVLVATLLNRNMIPEAAERTLVLWDGLADYRNAVVRQPDAQIVELLAQFAMGHPPTRQALQTRLMQYQSDVDAGKADLRRIEEWILLSSILNQPAAPVAWHDRLAADEANREQLAAVGPLLEPLLVGRNRYADLGRLYPDPAARVHELVQYEQAIVADPEMADNERGRQMAHLFFVSAAANLYAGVLTAQREQEAVAVSDAAVAGFGPDAAVFLVDTALSAGQPRQVHRQMLAAVTSHDDQVNALRSRLDTVLGPEAADDAPQP